MAVTTIDLAMRSQDATWTRERWGKLPADGNRYEVIDGVLYMSTAPSFFHQWIIRLLQRELFAQIDDRGIGLTLSSPIGVFMPGCDPVQPDLLVIRNEDMAMVRDGGIHGVPALLIEVVSPSNPNYDLRVKRQAYARAGVPEYWMFRPATRDALVCSNPDFSLGDYGHTDLVPPHGEILSPTLPFRAPVERFFEGAPDTTL